MHINFFSTCIGDAMRAKSAENAVLLLEKLGCTVHYPERQTCCGQPALNSGYINAAIPGIKANIVAMEENDYPIVSPAGSCTYTMMNYANYLIGEPDWQERARRMARRISDLTTFIVNTLGVVDVGARLEGRAVYHPSCSLSRKLGVTTEPLELLKHVKGLELMDFPGQTTCCGFGGTFATKMAEISGALVSEKVDNMMTVKPDYLIGADSSCLLNLGGRMHREGHPVRVMHIADVLMSV